MKKLLLSAAIAVLGLSQVSGQDAPAFGFAEGDVIIEGSLNFNSNNDKNTDTKTNSVGFTPKVGYFLQDDLAVGVALSINSNKREVSGTDTNDRSGFGFGVYGRYYFLDLGARFKTFAELGLGYETANDKISDVKENTIGAGVDLGLNYFVTEKIALTFGLKNVLGFSSSKLDVDGAKAESDFNLGFGDVSNPFGGTANFGILFKL